MNIFERDLRAATRDEVERLWPAMKAAHLFDEIADAAAFWREAPWRVQVAGKREAAVLERWRCDDTLLAIKALWASERHVSDLVRQLERVALEHGFERLLSPPVAEEAARAYRRAGMSIVERLVTLRLGRPRARRPGPASPPGISLREGSLDDLDALMGVDEQCFPAFWCYDRESMIRYILGERLGLAEEDGRLVGYTLSIVRGGAGTIGRLAVLPGHRGRGIGAALLEDAVAAAALAGAADVTLCTQEENEVSRRLYKRAGFQELHGRLVFLESPRLR